MRVCVARCVSWMFSESMCACVLASIAIGDAARMRHYVVLAVAPHVPRDSFVKKFQGVCCSGPLVNFGVHVTRMQASFWQPRFANFTMHACTIKCTKVMAAATEKPAADVRTAVTSRFIVMTSDHNVFLQPGLLS